MNESSTISAQNSIDAQLAALGLTPIVKDRFSDGSQYRQFAKCFFNPLHQYSSAVQSPSGEISYRCGDCEPKRKLWDEVVAQIRADGQASDGAGNGGRADENAAPKSEAGTPGTETQGAGGTYRVNRVYRVGSETPPSTLVVAGQYTKAGFSVVPIPHRQKRPNINGWQNFRLTEAELPEYFGNGPLNVGILLGTPNGLTDIDLDSPYAVIAGRTLLPDTNLVFGRDSKPASHYLYFTNPPAQYRKFVDPLDSRVTIAELRGQKKDGSIGLQSVAPPSVHTTGEVVRFEPRCNRSPASVDATVLSEAVAKVAAVALLACHWPSNGQRHDALLALAGGLARAEWPQPETEAFIRALCECLAQRDADFAGRIEDEVADVSDTYKRLGAGVSVTGWPALKVCVDAKVVDTCLAWLQVDQRGAPEGTSDGGVNLVYRVEANWPKPLAQAAFHGPAGDFVRIVEPHSEADPAALLTQFLVAIGNIIGRGPHFWAEKDQHFTNMNANMVGPTAKGRKGVSWGHIQDVCSVVDQDWSKKRITSGLASGEGLIAAVNNDADKRKLVMEPEFARVLAVMEREGNTLSSIIRQAWDTGDLDVLTRNTPLHAAGAHISVIGHITVDEVRRRLRETDKANGFANRFLWVCTKRSKVLPEGGNLDASDLQPVIAEIKRAVEFARSIGEVKRDESARSIWHKVYAELSEGKRGLMGAVTSRGEAQVMRLATVYALLDCSAVIRAEHLNAALEVWRYCEDSARCIFGDALGDAVADEILQALRSQPEGMTRDEIRNYFNRNRSSSEIGRALVVLQRCRLAKMKLDRTDGRSAERWFAV